MKLSEHFTKEELTYSDTAVKYKVANEPTEQQLKVLKHTCEYLLEPLRKLLNDNFVGTVYRGQPIKKVIIKITSGIRTKILNQTLKKEGYKPSETSQHCTGEAVDIQVILITEKDVRIYLSYLETYNLIKLWVKMGVLSVDQCIQEASYNSKKMLWEYWVHISHSAWGKTRDRKQFLIYKNGFYYKDY